MIGEFKNKLHHKIQMNILFYYFLVNLVTGVHVCDHFNKNLRHLLIN